MTTALNDLLKMNLKHQEIGIERAAELLEHMEVAREFNNSTSSLSVYIGDVPGVGVAIIMIPALGNTLLLTPA